MGDYQFQQALRMLELVAKTTGLDIADIIATTADDPYYLTDGELLGRLTGLVGLGAKECQYTDAVLDGIKRIHSFAPSLRLAQIVCNVGMMENKALADELNKKASEWKIQHRDAIAYRKHLLS